MSSASGSSSPPRARKQKEEERPRFFDTKAKTMCWATADTVPGRHPDRWRKDAAGNVVCKRFCNCQGCLCFEYDHIVPFSKGPFLVFYFFVKRDHIETQERWFIYVFDLILCCPSWWVCSCRIGFDGNVIENWNLSGFYLGKIWDDMFLGDIGNLCYLIVDLACFTQVLKWNLQEFRGFDRW